ncbi:GNAT family N-acetyltransferase [Ammoniphilus sp. YIM 78166]|uniref:GNAT family N-acetyltransferase n=1 Tax=Ammoniphilus sp. YIM 78166 TaxID=1644106 RepID=UPI00106FA71F|nr:GNAT family N-acetyltransferase [Ammoniphilus sp. YIM 78166]
MLPSRKSPYQWVTYSFTHLPLILHHQRELYSLNFARMNFDEQFYQNITQWYTEGIQLQDCHSFLLTDELEQLIGFYLFQRNDSTVYLMQMFVEKGYRGKGYGTLLLGHYEQMGKQLGAVSSFLHASQMNQQAVGFYLENRYVIIDQETDEDGSPRYLMFKNLRNKEAEGS